MDLFVLLDSSGSITKDTFDYTIKSQLGKFFGDLKIGPENLMVGLAQFSNLFVTKFNLKDNLNNSVIVQKLDDLEYLGGGTYTGKALDLIYNQTVFKNDLRTADKKILLVITDGEANGPLKDRSKFKTAEFFFDFFLVAEYAGKFKKDGVEIYTLGVGDEVDVAQLDIMATDKQHVLGCHDWETLSVNKFS